MTCTSVKQSIRKAVMLIKEETAANEACSQHRIASMVEAMRLDLSKSEEAASKTMKEIEVRHKHELEVQRQEYLANEVTQTEIKHKAIADAHAQVLAAEKASQQNLSTLEQLHKEQLVALKQEMRESEAALIEEHRKALESQRLDQISREEVGTKCSERERGTQQAGFRVLSKKKWPSMKQ